MPHYSEEFVNQIVLIKIFFDIFSEIMRKVLKGLGYRKFDGNLKQVAKNHFAELNR
jgi:hypothetical protein